MILDLGMIRTLNFRIIQGICPDLLYFRLKDGILLFGRK
jgi:hypothetical protein